MSNISTRMQVYAGGAWRWVTDAWLYDGGWVELDTLTQSGDGILTSLGTWGSPAQTTKYDVPGLGFLTVSAVSTTSVRVDWSEASPAAETTYDLVLVFTNPDHALPSYNATVTLPAGTRSSPTYTRSNAGLSGDPVTCTGHYRDPTQGYVGQSTTDTATLP